MADQAVFKRYEIKYLVTQEQKEKILKSMEPYMELDQYGRTTIRNIYYDTENYRLIRNSIEKPVYKEKLRVRSYKKADSQSKVFVELKKKYKHVVYKRRCSMTQEEAEQWLVGNRKCKNQNQITKEIDYFVTYYKTLCPAVFLSYEREAYYCKNGTDFRVTFDENVLFRQEQMSLTEDVWGTSLLPEGMMIMEIKCSGGIPLWMSSILSQEKIYKTSFSKYGTAYQKHIRYGMNSPCKDSKESLELYLEGEVYG